MVMVLVLIPFITITNNLTTDYLCLFMFPYFRDIICYLYMPIFLSKI